MRWLGGILLLAAAVTAADEPGPVVACPKLPGALRVDGKLSEEAWKQARPTVIDGRERIHPNYRKGWSGPQDLSGSVRAVRSGSDLYLGLEITDEARMHVAGRSWWAGDSIEVFFDSDLASEERGDAYSDDDLQLFLLPFHKGLRWGVVARGPSAPYPDGGLSGIEVAHTERPGGYVVEVKIPLANLRPLRPKAGRIGFDIAINDVDSGESTRAETYMTLSGRFELVSTPKNFARLELGSVAPPAATAAPNPVDWTGLLLGLAALAITLLVARRLSRLPLKRTHTRTALLCGVLAAGAALCAFLPRLAALLDERAARSRSREALDGAGAAARAYLDLDAGDADPSAARLLSLLRDGQVRTRPRYRYHFIPLSRPAVGSVRYGVRLAPGETRSFGLEGMAAPEALRLDLRLPAPDEREAARLPAAEVQVRFEGKKPRLQRVGRDARGAVLVDCTDAAGLPMRTIEVRNLLSHSTLVIDALYGRNEEGAWRCLPLAATTPGGVPIDVWQDTPPTHLVQVPAGGTHTVAPVGLAGDRLWLALRAEGAYPDSAYGESVATLRVFYRGGAPGPKLDLRNGRDMQDHRLLYARSSGIALEWEDKSRLPKHYTLHELAIDPSRPVERIEIEDRGVLGLLKVAAVTLGRRDSAEPPSWSGLVLRGDLVEVRQEMKRLWAGLGFSVRAGEAAPHAAGTLDGVRSRFELGDHTLDVWLPHTGWAIASLRAKGAVFALAALLLALAAVVAGAGLLQRARHLRVKMLVALGAATLLPLLFSFFSLTTLLNEQAETLLEEATLADLRGLQERIEASKAKARNLASLARDRLEFVRPRGQAALSHLVRRNREEIEAQGAFLRIPQLDARGPSPLGNVSFVDAASRSGLYYSPWDGVLALGVARASEQRRYFVGLRASALLGDQPSDEVATVLYGPDATPVAATGPIEPARRDGLRAALERRARPLYAPHDTSRAAAHALLREGGKVVGMLGVYRSRAPTEQRKAAIFRTLLLSGLAALLLVVLAGGMLVERVTNRLGRVTSAARSIAQGDLESRVPVEAEDEVGRLATSFNRMADALSERVRQLTELHRGLHELTAALDRVEVARAAADLLARATAAKHVLVAAVDRTTERVETLHRLGEGAPLGTRLPAEGPARDAVARQEPVQREGAVFLPLVAAGRTVGLAVCSPVPKDRELDRNFLDLSGRQIGIALENARLYRAAVTDELTGIYTHAFFVRRLKEEVDRAEATGRPLSLLRVVIDDYHAIARSQGAAAAARVVAESAATISEVMPTRNMVARREAGELLVLLVESDESDVRRQRDRLAEALQEKGPKAVFTYRSVTYPRDGEAADMLMDALLEVTETWEKAGVDSGPALKLPGGIMLGQSPTMRAALEIVARVAPTNATVLLSGETGAGKEVLADLIQSNSDRRHKPYVKVNCAAIPETLIETELFGHERGAFTGADRRRTGRFEEAHGGTLFLDEIGELPLPMQATLLRVLAERKLTRVGGWTPVPADVRILAASNRDLAKAVRQGAFRQDLYHRLHVIELRVPPLRERREEIAPLIDRFRERFNRQHGLEIDSFSPDALDALYRHAWPGNVRQLRNVVERAMVMASGKRVEREQIDLPDAEQEPPRPYVDGLTPRQERILALARENGGITNSAVVEEEEVSARTALRELQKLVERGLLVRVGRRRGAVYRPPEGAA